MINSEEYIAFVKRTFSFLESEFHLEFGNITVNGNAFYDIQYVDTEKVISISLENISNFYQVTLFILSEGKMPDYDDKTKTLHLNKLTKQFLKNIDKESLLENNQFFKEIEIKDETERMICKSAKDLRLCLHRDSDLKRPAYNKR